MTIAKKTDFQLVEPRPSLRNYVEAAWISNTTEAHVLHILPTSRPVLMTCDTPSGFGLALVGPLTTAQQVQLRRGNRKVGIWLKPGTCCLFQPGTMEMLRDNVAFGADMQPSAAFRQFDAGIQQVDDGLLMLDRLQDLLEQLVAKQLLARDTLVDAFVDKVQQDGMQSVKDNLADGMPISYRQFVRKFKQYSGLSPKEFLSINRLGSAVSSAISPHPARIADIAADHGYADHAHFTRELNLRTSITPSALADKQVIL